MHRLMIQGAAALMIVLLIALPSCATFQSASPVESVAATYATIDAVATATTTALITGTIDVAKARQVRDVLADIRQWTGAAETALQAGQPDTAAEYLNLASVALLAVRDLLE